MTNSNFRSGLESKRWRAQVRCGAVPLLLFYRNLRIMFESGVPLVQILESLSRQTEDANLTEVLHAVSSLVQSGHTLSGAMREFPNVFSDLVVGLVRTGERTGALSGALKEAESYAEGRWKLRRQMISTLTYPALVLTSAVLGSLLVCTTLLPRLLDTLVNLNGTLPWTTRLLMLCCNLATSPGFWLLAAGLVALARSFLRQTMARPAGRLAVARILRAVPVLGGFLATAALIRFAATSRVALATNHSLLAAMDLAFAACGDALLADDRAATLRDIREGNTWSGHLRTRPDLYPRLFASVLAAGEESGNVVPMLDRLIHILQEDLDYRAAVLSSSAEPILLASVAGLVAFCLVGILQPMYQTIGQF